MAINKEIWEMIQADYEFGSFDEEKVFSHLGVKYEVDRSTVSKKAKKHGWIWGKNSHIINREITVAKEMCKISIEKSQLNTSEKRILEEEKQIKLIEQGFTPQKIKIQGLIYKNTMRALKISQEALKDDEFDIDDVLKTLQSNKIAKEIIDDPKGIVVKSKNTQVIQGVQLIDA